MKDNKECDLVKDLLKTYIDELTCDESNEFIKKHISECDSCLNEYNKLLNDDKSNEQEIISIKNMKLQVKVRFIICTIIGILLTGLYIYSECKQSFILDRLSMDEVIVVSLVAIGLYFIPLIALFTSLLWSKVASNKKQAFIPNAFVVFFLVLIIVQFINLISKF